MAKIRNVGQLQDALDNEMGWRIKEISELKLSVRGASSLSQGTLIRAGLALLYAHWEGFIKNSSLNYLEFVNNQGCRYGDLKTCFIVLGVKSYTVRLGESKKSKSNIDAVDFLLSELDKPSKMIRHLRLIQSLTWGQVFLIIYFVL